MPARWIRTYVRNVCSDCPLHIDLPSPDPDPDGDDASDGFGKVIMVVNGAQPVWLLIVQNREHPSDADASYDFKVRA